MTALSLVHHLDRTAVQRCNRINQRFWGRIFSVMSRLGNGGLWYAVMLGLLIVPATPAWPLVLAMLAAGIIGHLVYLGLKKGTRRPRPCQVLSSLRLTVAPLDHFSFPSGHTLHAVCFCIMVTQHFPTLGFLLIPLTILVALSRLVLGLHYPSDVLMGGVVGTVLASGSLAILDNISPRLSTM